MNRIVVTSYEGRKYIIFIKGDVPVKIRVLSDGNFYPDAVYVGCVRNKKDNIGASFVSYGNKQFGFLRRNDLKGGTLLPVIVKKQTDGRKEDVLTDDISLCGVYTVVKENASPDIMFSSKLPDDFKSEFRTYISENRNALANLSKDCINDKAHTANEDADSTNINSANKHGVIIRSNAANADFDSILNEYSYLSDKLNRITEYSNSRTEGTLLYHGLSECMTYVFSENLLDYDELLTDDDDTYSEISLFISEYKKAGITLPINAKKYEDYDYPLCKLISIKRLLSYALDKKVYLKSNAYITIEHTEAMTVIDVNSATTSFTGKRSDVIHRVNLEAAKEIIGQLKLRNISGIIVVDFINEADKNNRRELEAYIKELIKTDDSGAKFVSFTKLGLAEITRTRRSRPLYEQIKAR